MEYVGGRVKVVADLEAGEIRLIGVVDGEEQCGFSMDPGAAYSLVEALIYVLDRYFSDKPIGYKKPRGPNIVFEVVGGGEEEG